MRTYTVECFSTLRTRRYPKTVQFSHGVFGLSSKGWVAEQWSVLEASSKRNPYSYAKIAAYHSILKLLARSRKARQILDLSTAEVSRKDLTQLFTLMEAELTTLTHTNNTKTRNSAYFRNVVIDCAKVLGIQDAHRTALGFKTRFTERAKPRKLISDFVSQEADIELRAPIAALPHKGMKDLLAKAENKLGYDIQRIRDACIEELKGAAQLRESLKVFELQAANASVEERKLASRIVHNGYGNNPNARERMENLGPERLLGLYRIIITEDRLAYLTRPISPQFSKYRHLITAVLPELASFAEHSPKALYLPERIHSRELVAILVLLLTYTAWNTHSLLNMEVGGIEINERQISIQGFKTKVGDYTPRVYLDSSQPYAREAIQLLLWNREQLIKLGFLEKTDQRLWFAWSSKWEKLSHQYLGQQDVLSDFQQRYGLPSFSLEQIRPQRFAYDSLRTGNPELVRNIAGHQSLAQTGHYLEQIILNRLNQAINLDFQRRLESTVKFRMSSEDPRLGDRLDPRFVDERILIPIGDGASCANPWKPPDEAFLEGNLCKANHCHAGDGCPNLRIKINSSRMQELVRKRQYYLKNWSRLEANNPKAFEVMHGPAILFTLGLYDYIATGRHGHTLKEIEGEVLRENGK